MERKATKPPGVVGKVYRVIMGILKSNGKTATQTFRYKRTVWSEAQAKSHCKAHNGKLFEPATGGKAVDLDEPVDNYVMLDDGTRVQIEEAPPEMVKKYETESADEDGKDRFESLADAVGTEGQGEERLTCRIVKVAPKKRKITCAVYVPMKVDAHRNFMTAEEIEKASDFFMLNHRNVDEMHDMVKGVGGIVQNYIAKKNDPDGFVEGTWVVELKIFTDAAWKKVLKGEYKGISMAGTRLLGKKIENMESEWVDEDGNFKNPYDEE